MQQEVYTAQNGAPPASVNDQHLACVLLLDVSGSMNGQPIDSLNAAVKRFKSQCESDSALSRSLDIAIVTFASEVRVVQEFTPVGRMEAPKLQASGQTSMGLGLTTALELLEQRKQMYREFGTPYHRPWVFMISDGEPTDEYAAAFAQVKQMQEKKKVEVWAVGVPGYNTDILKSLTKRVVELDEELNFAGLFEWLSNSLAAKSNSNIGDTVQYDALPEGSRVVPSDWG